MSRDMVKKLIKEAGLRIIKESVAEEDGLEGRMYNNRDYLVVVGLMEKDIQQTQQG